MNGQLVHICKHVCWPILLGLGLCRAWFIGCSAFARVTTGQIAWLSMLGYGSFVIGACLYVILTRFSPRFMKAMMSGKFFMSIVLVGAVGTTSLCLGVMEDTTAYLTSGITAVGISAGILETMWTFQLIRQHPVAIYLNIFGVMLVSSVFDLGLELLSTPLFLLLALTLLLTSGICFYDMDKQTQPTRKLEGTRVDGPASLSSQQDKQNAADKKLLIRIVIVCFAYCVVHMVAAMTAGTGVFEGNSLFVRSATNLLVTIALAILFAWRRQTYAVTLFRLILPVTVLGLIMQSLATTSPEGVSFVILCAGNKMYDVLSLVLLAECVNKFALGAPAAILFTGLFVSARSGGNLIGIALGQLATNPRIPYVTPEGLVLAMILVAIACFFWLLSERTLFDQLSDKSHVSPESVSQTISVSSAVIESLAKRCGLTTREHEVFALLARGKNHQAIMKELSISKGTAHAHVSHVYQKTGVHSQQELISLVEAENDQLDISSKKSSR